MSGEQDQSLDEDRQLAALMRAAQDGDGSAYAQLLTHITPLLRRTLRQRNRHLQPQDVEDLVQDILLSLHAVRATYDPARPFLPWLFGIARNRTADGARRYLRRAAHEVVVERVPETFSPDATNMMEDGYRDPEALAQAMRLLPSGQREALEMVKLREMSLKEASEVTGMSIGSLKVAVHRATRALRRILTAEA